LIPAIGLFSIFKRYRDVEALRGVSLEIRQGEFFGLLGPNGAGKTTLISIVAGLARADSGEVRIMGHDVIGDYRGARRSLGVVPQELVFDPFFTVRETLRLTSGYYGIRGNDRWIDELLENLDLTSKADANMRSLSGGMKRRVLIAQALVHRPPVIVLDEPTAGVDVELRQSLWQFIRRLNRDGQTIVLTTHYLEEAEELCGRIAILKQGQVVALDDTRSLLRKFPGARLQLGLSGASLPPSLEGLRLPVSSNGVASSPAGLAIERVSLRMDDYSSVEPVLAAIRQGGCRIEEMELLKADLEDVFVNLTRDVRP